MRAGGQLRLGNRQLLGIWQARSSSRVRQEPGSNLGMSLVYDVAHNIAKMETHEVEGNEATVCVHRKGATRAFPAGPPRGARAVSARSASR